MEKKLRVFEMADGRRLEVDAEDLEYIFKGYRPRLMDLEDFKVIRRIINKEVKKYLKGTVVHLSKVTDEVFASYTKGLKHKAKQKGVTYVKKTT
jgi:hypothetical protein